MNFPVILKAFEETFSHDLLIEERRINNQLEYDLFINQFNGKKIVTVAIPNWGERVFQQHKREPDFAVVWTKKELGSKDFIEINSAIQKMIDEGVLIPGSFNGYRKTTLKHDLVETKNYLEALLLLKEDNKPQRDNVNKSISNKPNNKSITGSVTVISKIIGIIVGLIAIYEFILKQIFNTESIIELLQR